MICSGRDKIETPEQVCPLRPNYVQAFGIDQTDEELSTLDTSHDTLCINYLGFVQFKQAEDTANKLELDGLVVIGGDDSNTNACLIAEYFRLAVKNANHFMLPSQCYSLPPYCCEIREGHFPFPLYYPALRHHNYCLGFNSFIIISNISLEFCLPLCK